jgi:hypothetical protein
MPSFAIPHQTCLRPTPSLMPTTQRGSSGPCKGSQVLRLGSTKHQVNQQCFTMGQATEL